MNDIKAPIFGTKLTLTLIENKLREKKRKSEKNYWGFYALILLIGSFVFYAICYVFMFFIGLTKDKRTIKAFFSIIENSLRVTNLSGAKIPFPFPFHLSQHHQRQHQQEPRSRNQRPPYSPHCQTSQASFTFGSNAF